MWWQKNFLWRGGIKEGNFWKSNLNDTTQEFLGTSCTFLWSIICILFIYTWYIASITTFIDLITCISRAAVRCMWIHRHAPISHMHLGPRLATRCMSSCSEWLWPVAWSDREPNTRRRRKISRGWVSKLPLSPTYIYLTRIITCLHSQSHTYTHYPWETDKTSHPVLGHWSMGRKVWRSGLLLQYVVLRTSPQRPIPVQTSLFRISISLSGCRWGKFVIVTSSHKRISGSWC